MENQMSEVKLGETKVDIVWFYGELFQFFLGKLTINYNLTTLFTFYMLILHKYRTVNNSRNKT